MALLLLVPLTAAAFGLYWLFKPPVEYAASRDAGIPEVDKEMLEENVQIATVHSAPLTIGKPVEK